MLSEIPDGTVVIDLDAPLTMAPYNIHVKDAEGGWPGAEWIQVGDDNHSAGPRNFRILYQPS